MASVSNIQNIMDTYGLDKTKKAQSGEDLNKDAFLQLLVTQMQYQDPLAPTKNEDFLAQMAQFSALEQMQNLNTSFTMQQANSMIGKSVIGLFVNEVTNASEYVQGTVSAVKLKNGETFLSVEGKDLKLSNVEAILSESADTTKIVEALSEINVTLATIQQRLDNLAAGDEEA